MQVLSKVTKLILEIPKSDRRVSFPKDAKISSYGLNNETPSIIVHNATTNEWQGAHEGVIVVNEVPQHVAGGLLTRFEINTIEDLDIFIAQLVKLGYTDQYTAPYEFVDAQTNPMFTVGKYTGIFRRKANPCELRRLGDEYQIFVKGFDWRRIEPEILKRSYLKTDGSEIQLEEIPCV